MPDNIERTIYKLEIDDSGYIRGVESLSASTQKLVDVQNSANKTLQINENALKVSADVLKKAKKDLDDYTGSNETYRKQLEKFFKSAEADNIRNTQLVNENRKAYEAATKAALDFANTSARATNLQQNTTGGKIPTAAPPPLQVGLGINSQILGALNIPELTAQAEIVAQTRQEFDELRDSIALAEARMKQLNETDEEFKTLAPIVEKGKIALKQYDDVTKSASDSSLSLRTQITKGREELVRLEEAGKGTSQEYITLEKNVAKLTNAFEDQRNRIKVLASETRLLDFGKAAIQSAISGFQVYTSVAVLAGGASEELQKKTLQLFAAMQLLTSLEQLAAQVKRGGTLATNLQTAATSIYTAVVRTSTGALKGFREALLATGIGAAVLAIGFLVEKFRQLRDAEDEAGKKQKLYNDILKEAGSSYTKAVVEVNELRNNIQLAKEGFISKTEVVKQYNETIGKTTGSVSNLDEAEQGLIKNAEAYIKFTLLKSAANIAFGQAAEKVFKIELDRQKADREFLSGFQKATEIKSFGIFGNEESLKKEAAKQKQAAIQKSEDDRKLLQGIGEKFQKDAAEISKEFNFNFFGKPPPVPEKSTIINVFEEEKAKLLAKLSELRNNEAENISKINKEFADKLVVEKIRIEKLIKDKKLTGNILDEKSQAGILFTLSIQINEKERDKKIEAFRKSIIDARNKLNDELNNLESKNIQDNLNLIQDEFDRRAALIDFNEKKEITNAEENTQKRLDALDFDRLLIGEQAYQDAKARIISAGELAALNIIRKAAQERKNLAADTFKQSLDSLSNLFKIQLLQLDETTAGKIEEEKKLFATGIINYDQFQKAITKILKDQKAARDRLRLIELNTEIAGIDKRLKTTTDETEKAELQKRQIDLRSQRAELKSQTTVDDPNKTRVEKVQQYAEAIGQVVDSVVAFWQKANEAESAALDRSISLQEKRVDAARRIAERGNAQYLKQEQDRLTQLNIQRENAARRQLAIDAALQASQVLVGITGAISHLASGPLGAAAVIADIAIIIGALATGYGLVKSLQGNVPKLKTGTTYLKRESHPSGTDTIPVMANEGEAWIPTETNRQYHPAVKAIYNKTIPAETLNEFVENYTTNKITKNIFNKDIKEVVNTSHVEKIVNNVVTKHLNDFITIHKIKEVPQVDYNRIKDAAELNINHDGKMSVLLTEHSNLLRENNELQRQILKKKILVEQHIDRNGVAAMVTDYITQKEIDRHS